MNQVRILYNPRTNGAEPEKFKSVEAELGAEHEFIYEDITGIEDLCAYLDGIDAEDTVVIAGGDGTLNHQVNKLNGREPGRELLYYPCGSGNDFFTDVKTEGDKLISLNRYIKSLPAVTVKGNTSRFINGVGFGIDGYCCEEGERLRGLGQTKINYTGIAIKGLLLYFKTAGATVTVDGVEHHFKHVWLAPTMVGRYYGGGMQIAPDQDRFNGDKTLSVVVLHTRSKLKGLMIFPNIFKGTHINNKKNVAVLTGKEITVTFDRPTPLQIDGEPVSNVTTYTASFAE